MWLEQKYAIAWASRDPDQQSLERALIDPAQKYDHAVREGEVIGVWREEASLLRPLGWESWLRRRQEPLAHFSRRRENAWSVPAIGGVLGTAYLIASKFPAPGWSPIFGAGYLLMLVAWGLPYRGLLERRCLEVLGRRIRPHVQSRRAR